MVINACRRPHAKTQSRRRRKRGKPSPGADVGGMTAWRTKAASRARGKHAADRPWKASQQAPDFLCMEARKELSRGSTAAWQSRLEWDPALSLSLGVFSAWAGRHPHLL